MYISVMSLGNGAQAVWHGNSDGSWDEGRVVWFVLEDAQGQSAVVCIDDRKKSPTCHRLFTGAKHPSDPEATLVELGSEVEGIIVSAISHYLDSSEFDHPFYELGGKELLQNALLHLGDSPD